MAEYSVKIKVYGKGEHICKKCFHYAVCTYQKSNNPIIECSHFVVERKHGKWIDGNCSVCGKGKLCYGDRSFCTSPYCPWCGAYMTESKGADDNPK